jgi:hypothetical protein
MIRNVEEDSELMEMQIPKQFEPQSISLNEDMALISTGRLYLNSS